MNSADRKTVLLSIHVDLGENDPKIEEVNDVVDHLIESLRCEGIGCFFTEDTENRPEAFQEAD